MDGKRKGERKGKEDKGDGREENRVIGGNGWEGKGRGRRGR